ncbi:MAG: hypothetical protein Q9180_004567 [Flavoplaca navasiana]
MAYVNSSENMPPENLATVAFLERFRQTALAARIGTQYQHEVQFVDKVIQKLDAGISLAKSLDPLADNHTLTKARDLRINLVRQGLIEKRPIDRSSLKSTLPSLYNPLDRNTWPYVWTQDWNGYKANEPVVVATSSRKFKEFVQKNGDNALFIDPAPKLGVVQTIQPGSSGNLKGNGEGSSKAREVQDFF